MSKTVLLIPMCILALQAGAEIVDQLSECKYARLEEVRMLSLEGREEKQYQALISTLLKHRVIEKNSNQILTKVHACWQRFQTLHDSSIDFNLEMESATSILLEYEGRQFTFKSFKSSKLAAQIDKSIKSVFPAEKDRPLGNILWFLWVEAAMAATGEKYNYYYYADELLWRRTEAEGRSFSVGFIPDMKNNQTYINKIIDSQLLGAGLTQGMHVENLESSAIDSADMASWWNQVDPFTYTFKVNDKNYEFKSVSYIHTSAYALPLAEFLYIRIDFFSARTDIELSRIMREANNYKGIIIDVRNNRGGVISPRAIDFFLKPAQEVLVFTNEGEAQEKLFGTMAYIDKPLVVIQNKHSASMSEVLAGMLQSQHRASIVGERSTGKAVGQTSFPVSDEGQVLLVKTHYFYTDGATHWGGVGVEPDLKLDISKEEKNKIALELTNSRVDLDYLQSFDHGLQAAVRILENLGGEEQ